MRVFLFHNIYNYQFLIFEKQSKKMDKLLLENIHRIHEIMGISVRKLLLERLGDDIIQLLTKTIIGSSEQFGAVIKSINNLTPFSTIERTVKDLYLSISKSSDSQIIIDAITNLQKKVKYAGKPEAEILYEILKNPEDFREFTDEIAELQTKITLGIGNYKIVSSLDDLVEKSSGAYREMLLNAVETLDNVKNQMLDLKIEQIDDFVSDVTSKIEAATSVGKKTKNFYITSLTKIADDVKQSKSGTEIINYMGEKPLGEFKNELSKVRTVDDYIRTVKDNFPMTEDQAINFLKNYKGDLFQDFSEFRVGFPKDDYVKVASFLKNKNFISAPIGEYLYHGTDSKTVDDIIASGWLDNSLGVEINPGSLGQILKKTTATGDINTAKIYASSTARQKGTEQVLLRFDNLNNEPITFFAHVPRVPVSQIEKSLDGGKTWTKVLDK